MLPIIIEEQIICYADKFYSKIEEGLPQEKSVNKILAELSKYGKDNVQRFKNWLELFGN